MTFSISIKKLNIIWYSIASAYKVKLGKAQSFGLLLSASKERYIEIKYHVVIRVRRTYQTLCSKRHNILIKALITHNNCNNIQWTSE